MKDEGNWESNELSLTLHRLQVENELLNHGNGGLRQALLAKKRQKKRGKTLDLRQRKEYYSGANFWSPRKFLEAVAREKVKKKEECMQELARANKKELQHASKLPREKEKEERRVAREAAKEVKEEKAEKAAERARKIAAQNTRKAVQTARTGKRKASRASSPKCKRQKSLGRAAAVALSSEAAPAATAKLNSRGRPIRKPAKYN